MMAINFTLEFQKINPVDQNEMMLVEFKLAIMEMKL
jgi:hypothetical protein